jgi:xanthine dehydrogenase YagR molybdenum-binding subunit
MPHIRVVSNFIGGGFGAKGNGWPHNFLTSIAARELGRPLRLELTRRQMQTLTGYQPATRQTIRLGATSDGKITATQHESTSQSGFDDFLELTANATKMMYDVPNLATRSLIVKTNHVSGAFMRPPGEGPGLFALECAMDELAEKLKLDPIELRRRNHTMQDLEVNKPFSAKGLLDCYTQGAARIGWDARNPLPRSMREGRERVGFGMASAVRQVFQMNSNAEVVMRADGTAVVKLSLAEIGGGAYTTMVQVAADELGLPYNRVSIEGGDSILPASGPSFGSVTSTGTVNSVRNAAINLREQLVSRAVSSAESPLNRAKPEDVIPQDGKLVLKSDPNKGETYAAIIRRSVNIGGKDLTGPDLERVVGIGSFEFNAEKFPYSTYSFGAQFAEVRVDEQLGRVRLVRFVGAFSSGRILNLKTATSQAKGGIVYAVGATLTEGIEHDLTSGRLLNANLFDYLVPSNADIPSGNIDVIFVDDNEVKANPLGSKGLGEIVSVGVNAAIANAVYHATGKRVRELPITVERLL